MGKVDDRTTENQATQKYHQTIKSVVMVNGERCTHYKHYFDKFLPERLGLGIPDYLDFSFHRIPPLN
jgi:hypothetical protein